MPYEGFNSHSDALSSSPAIHHLRLRILVHELSSKNFSVVADRTAMKDMLSNIETHFNLFSREQRFPVTGLHVFLDLADWNKKWQDLQSALDFKSGDKDPKKYPKSQLSSGDQEQLNWDLNDANQVFRNTLRIMSNQLATLEGVYDRQSFEKEYHLRWHDNFETDTFFRSTPFSFRPRGFYVDPLDLESDVWPMLANVNTIFELPNIPIRNDYIYLWGVRSAAERPRMRIDVVTGRIDECVSVITAD